MKAYRVVVYRETFVLEHESIMLCHRLCRQVDQSSVLEKENVYSVYMLLLRSSHLPHWPNHSSLMVSIQF